MSKFGSGLASRIIAAGLAILAPLCVAQAQTKYNPLTYSGPDRQAKLIAGAKKEGKVVFYSGIIVNQALQPLVDAFGKKYPFLKVSFWRANSEEILAKVIAETRGDNHIGDVIEGTGIGGPALAAGIVQPFTTPQLAAFPKKYRDPNHMWAPTRLSYFGTAYNTHLVPPKNIPKTYEALLDPRWKGKMAWSFGPETGTALFLTNLRIAWGDAKAMAYFKKLAKQHVVDYGATARALVDRVISGEFDLALGIYAHHPLISRALGAPVNTVLMNPVASAAGTVLIPKGVKDPNAAMLLVDFLLSKSGQEILAKSKYFPVRRDVPPLAQLSSIVPEKAGYQENFISPEAIYKYGESSTKIANEDFR